MSLKKVFASVAHAIGIGSAASSATISTASLATLQLGNSLAGSLAVAAEQTSPIGAAIAAGIKAANEAAATNPAMSSGEKLATALEIATPAVVTEAAKVGLTGIEAEAARFAEMAIENALSLLKATPLAKLGAALLHDIGVNV